MNWSICSGGPGTTSVGSDGQTDSDCVGDQLEVFSPRCCAWFSWNTIVWCGMWSQTLSCLRSLSPIWCQKLEVLQTLVQHWNVNPFCLHMLCFRVGCWLEVYSTYMWHWDLATLLIPKLPCCRGEFSLCLQGNSQGNTIDIVDLTQVRWGWNG